MKRIIILILSIIVSNTITSQELEIEKNKTSRTNNSIIYSTLAVTNDVPCSAINLVNGDCRTASTFNTTNYTTNGATSNTTGTGTVPTPSCWSSGFSTTVWFKFTATTTSQKISTDVQLSGGGVNNDNQIAVYKSSNGLCSGNFTLIGCQDDICNCTGPGNNQQAELTVNGLTIGTTYWIAIDGDGTNDGIFRICTQPAPINDNCSSAQNMTSGVVYSSSNVGASPYTNVGSGSYPSTGTGDVNFTCGSTENMVYYTFTAPSTGTFYLEQSAQNCAGAGTQLMVFKSSYNCNTLPENPMTAASTTYELVCSSASTLYRYFTMSLTAGQTYIIGVDGYAGDECTYNISIGPLLILPIELVSFEAYNHESYNYITWVCATETNNDYFNLERSNDGYTWESINIVDGAGTSNVGTMYSYKDYTFNET